MEESINDEVRKLSDWYEVVSVNMVENWSL